MNERIVDRIKALPERVRRRMGCIGVEKTRHFADEATRNRFTKQGQQLLEEIMPSVGINIHVESRTVSSKLDIE